MDNDEFLGLLTIVSFAIGLQNLEENVSQNQMQETVQKAVSEIHMHLEMQDNKIDEILRRIGGK